MMEHIKPEKLGSVALEASPQAATFVVSDLRQFQDAIAAAQLNGETFIEVDEKVFQYFTKGRSTPYFTYGNPGIRVYLHGTKEAIEIEEARQIL